MNSISGRSRTALGFDFGRVRIGVAVGQELTATARPLAILPTRRQTPDWEAIARLIAEWRPELLVVGIPRHADNSPSAVTAAALRFSGQLEERYRLPVATIDERLSSWEAAARRGTASGRRGGRMLDAAAAALILESWFHQQSA